MDAHWDGDTLSIKTVEPDHLARAVEVLRINNAGCGCRDASESRFAGIRLADVQALFERPQMPAERLASYLDRARFEPGPLPSLAETLLHASVPAPCVAHAHPVSILALAAAPNGDRVRVVYGERAVWLPPVSSPLERARLTAEAVRANSQAHCLVLAGAGLVTWGDSPRDCDERMRYLIGAADASIAARMPARPFGERVVQPLTPDERHDLMARALPVIRGAVGRAGLAVDDTPEVLDFVCADGSREMSQALTPTSLWLHWQPEAGVETLLELAVGDAVDLALAESGQRSRVILIPGVGMVVSGARVADAERARHMYRRQIAILRATQALDGSVTRAPTETYPAPSGAPAPRPTPLAAGAALQGRVALVTGAASGIGRAIARRFASEGACVVIADIDEVGAQAVAEELVEQHGLKAGIAVRCDVTDEAAVSAVFRRATLEYGGVDIVVNNAGIAMSAPIEETSLAMWQHCHSILAQGYFLVAREAFRLWRAQGLGGNLVVIGSKNAVAAQKNAVAYSTAKASEVHMARCLAEEGGAAGIRVNTILPDAVLAGTRIFSSAWRDERAATYGIAPDQLEDYYRARTTLKVNVLPEDIAEAALFFASDRSRKTTGAILTVDGGVATAYTR